jgi:ElaB/YqjD/DUF883 family membrane-anchored ribosome-binding protein
MNRYETPGALRHDARTLADDARALLNATAEVTDKKVTEARKHLAEALEAGRETCNRLQEKAVHSAQIADKTVRSHPYESLGVAFGIGALIGFLLSRRD